MTVAELIKERPVIFSAPMVKAILEGRKNQTRRVVKPRGLGFIDCCCSGTAAQWMSEGDRWYCGTCGGGARLTPRDVEHIRCPRGQPGDRLLVKETFFAFGRWETRFSEKKKRDEWHFIDMTKECGKSYHYAADGAPLGYAEKCNEGRGGVEPTWWRRPSIFMPRAASRITLEITGVRVERLQGISEADAIAEGLIRARGPFGLTMWEYDKTVGGQFSDPRVAYRMLWESIYGPGSWDLNPWLWTIEFNRLT